MTPLPRIYSVLVVADTESFPKFITPLLPESEFSPVQIVRSVTHARQILAERDFDLVIIDTPLPDDFGTRLAVDVSAESSTIAMLLVRSDVYNNVYVRTVQNGVMVVKKPVSQPMIQMSLHYMCAMKERLRRMQKKTLSVQDKIAEMRLINRAKWILIDKHGMTEQEAHRWIEKKAMDGCISKREAAQHVIDCGLE